MTPTNYHEIGALLRQAREQMGLSLLQASQGLHIRARYLDALEQGNLNELPGLAYTKGYLHAYAGFLGLDQKEIARRYEQVEEALPRKGFYFPEVFSKEKTPSNQVVWGGLAAAFVLYVLWWLLFSPVPLTPDVAETPPLQETRSFQMPSIMNHACLRTPSVLYPPCYKTRAVFVGVDGLYPPVSQVNSIMELAVQ